MGDDAINLRDQVAVLRRRWRIVVMCAVGGLLLALAVSLTQSSLYRSSTTLLLSPINAAQIASNGDVMQPTEIATQVQVVLSEAVAVKVISDLNLDETPEQLVKTVTVEPEAETRVISITALRSTASQARDVANAFADNYLSVREGQADLENEAAVAALEAQAQEVNDRLTEIDQELTTATGSEVTRLRSEQQSLLVQSTQILGDQADLAQLSPDALGNGGQVLKPAAAPKGAAEPQPTKSAVIGLFLGTLLGIGLAFTRDHFDDAVRDEGRLREALAPRPVLGRIPQWVNAKTGRLVTVLDPASQVSEAYRALSTSIRFMLAVPGPPRPAGQAGQSIASGGSLARASDSRPTTGKVLLVASPNNQEGKTSVASNLAVVSARFGLRVVLVDADLRNPQLANVFGLGHPPGLSDLLVSNDRHEDYVVEIEDLKVLPGGSLAPNPAELLASTRMAELLATLATKADLVIVDTTPVTRASDGLELVGSSDLVLLVARHGQTRFRGIEQTIDLIHQVGGDVSGVVYFGFPSRAGADPYGHGFSYSGDGSGEIAPYPDAHSPTANSGDGHQGEPDEPDRSTSDRPTSSGPSSTEPTPGGPTRISKASR